MAPTSKQPQFATFYNTKFAGSNLASGGLRAQVVGAPVLTAGIEGKELPYLTTTGGTHYLMTSVPETPSGTIITVARMMVPPTGNVNDGVVVGNYDAGNTMLLYTAATAPEGAVRGRMPQLSPAGFNAVPPLKSQMRDWLLCALRWSCTENVSSGTVQCITLNAKSSQTGAGLNAKLGTSYLSIGSQSYSVNTKNQSGVIDHAFTGIWDYQLNEDEMGDVVGIIKNWGLKYGQKI
ncbi:hypothetical protein AA106555_1610 [Neokomagataea thailandica NBRC 106555]|nr:MULTISPECIES: hypothetical protein [Neokomagataea]GBR54253.1 hypothetical protein AA106555_1610 [Neokomagataea thailandica NBRC 106555]